MEIYTEALFTYGTLQHEEVQLVLFNRKLEGTLDILIGYELCPYHLPDNPNSPVVNLSIYTVIIPANTNSLVEGMLYHLDQDELAVADRYETNAYKRIRVNLVSGASAWTYVKAG